MESGKNPDLTDSIYGVGDIYYTIRILQSNVLFHHI